MTAVDNHAFHKLCEQGGWPIRTINAKSATDGLQGEIFVLIHV